MKTQIITTAAGAVLAAALGLGAVSAAQAAEVEVKHAVARVVVIPEARSDIKVEVSGSSPSLPAIQVSTSPSGKVIVEGGMDRRIRGCSTHGVNAGTIDPISPPDGVVIRLRGAPDVRLKDAPLITIHTPMDVHVDANGAVFGSIGRSDSVDLGNAGCGDWTVANTRGAIRISEAGSGDVRTGSAGEAHASVAGSGDIAFGPVSNLKASIAGSGDITAASASGWVEASIAGSGDVRVRGGKVDRVKASIAGSGDVTVDGPVGDVDASIMGSGDVRVGSASGRVSKSIMGSGSIVIGGKETTRKDHSE
jgi:hypothetical protein